MLPKTLVMWDLSFIVWLIKFVTWVVIAENMCKDEIIIVFKHIYIIDSLLIEFIHKLQQFWGFKFKFSNWVMSTIQSYHNISSYGTTTWASFSKETHFLKPLIFIKRALFPDQIHTFYITQLMIEIISETCTENKFIFYKIHSCICLLFYSLYIASRYSYIVLIISL